MPRTSVNPKSTTIRSSVSTTADWSVPIFSSSTNSAHVALGEGNRYGGQIFSQKTTCQPATKTTRAMAMSRTVVSDCLRARLDLLSDIEIAFSCCKSVLLPQVLQYRAYRACQPRILDVPGPLQVDDVLLLNPGRP